MCKQLLKIIFSSCKLWLTHETFGNLLTSLLCSCALSQTLLSPQSFERHFYGVFQWKLVVCLMKVLLNCVWERKMSPFLISWKMSPFGSFLWIFPGKQHASMGLPPKVSLNIIAFECMQYSYTNVTVCIFKKRKLTTFCILQGSNTLPRAGQRNKLKQPGLGSVDDSEIVITKKLTGGGSSVRIRIGGSARSPTEQVRLWRCWWWLGWRSWWWRWQRWWWC